MNASKTKLLWRVNVISFSILSLLFFTGLANWILFPGGPGTSHGMAASVRGFLCAIHRWGAVGFMILIGIHLFLHLDYIRRSWEKHGL